MRERQRRRDVLALYEKQRISDQLAYHEQRLKVAQRGRRQILDLSTLLYTATAFIGAMAASSVGSRTMWAVLAAATGAGASALTGYALMAGFERNEEQSRQVLAALSLLEASRPVSFMVDGATGGRIVSDYVRKVESLLQQDVELWARSAESDQQELDSQDAAAQDAADSAIQNGSLNGSSTTDDSAALDDFTVSVDESGNASASTNAG